MEELQNKNAEEMKKVNRFVNFSKRILEEANTTSDDFYKGNKYSIGSRVKKKRDYTKEQAEEVIKNGDSEELRELSLSYFYSSGFYKRLIIHYSTILYYTPLLIPHMTGMKKKITDKKYQQKYFSALEFISSLNFEQLCRTFSKTVLTEGAFYGFLKEVQGKYSIQELPFEYCRSRLKSFSGVDIVEFNVQWFDKGIDAEIKKEALRVFPKEIRLGYNQYRKGKLPSPWVRIPIEKGIHFQLLEERPFFSCVIPSIINSNDYVDIEKSKDLQKLKAILYQKIPHTTAGTLVFEPEEALEFHKGLAEIARKNDFLDAFTTYGDFEVKRILDDDSTVKDNIEKLNKTLYKESGVSQELFAADGNISLEKSIQNDINLMMYLANSYSIWLKNLINYLFGDNNISFSVEILPVGQYNSKDYLSQSLNAAQYGYSFIIPSLAMGLEQNQLLDLKSIETDVLHMDKILVPLRSSHTESSKLSAGTTKEDAEKEGPAKQEEELSDKTIQNKEYAGEVSEN